MASMQPSASDSVGRGSGGDERAEQPVMLVNGDTRLAQVTSPATEVLPQNRLTVAVHAQVRTIHINTLQLTGLNGLFLHHYLSRGI